MNEPIQDACIRLDHASHSFHALMAMLSSCRSPLDPQDLFHLMQPITGEVDAALDDLKNA